VEYVCKIWTKNSQPLEKKCQKTSGGLTHNVQCTTRKQSYGKNVVLLVKQLLINGKDCDCKYKLDSVGRVSFLLNVVEIIHYQSLHLGRFHVRHEPDRKFPNNFARNHRFAASAIESTLDSCCNQKCTEIQAPTRVMGKCRNSLISFKINK